MILPIGTRVWVALSACPDVGRTGWASDGTVIAHVPCSPCWQRVITVRSFHTIDSVIDALEQAGATCDQPYAFTVLADDGERRTTVVPGDAGVIAVPIAESEAA